MTKNPRFQIGKKSKQMQDAPEMQGFPVNHPNMVNFAD